LEQAGEKRAEGPTLNMKPIFLALLTLSLSALALAQPLSMTLVAPPISAAAGSEVQVELVVFNTGATAQDLVVPAEIPARLVLAGRTETVTLKTPAESLRGAVPSSGFVRIPYVFRLPVAVPHRTVLELEQPAKLFAVLDTSSSPVPLASTPAGSETDKTTLSASAGRSGLMPRPAASRIERTFREHFGTHEPVYFIYGADEPGAKFQLSFKYRLFGDASDRPETTRNSVQFAYTQRSLWDLEGESSPFQDTSYMPEVFFEHLTPDNPEGIRWLTWLGLQAGYKHESNGRGGLDSRSMNTVFVRSALALGDLEGWRVILEPRVFKYISDMDDNPDMKRYPGYGEMRVIVGKNDDFELVAAGRLGSDRRRPTIQLDLTLPLRIKFGDFASYALIQYFHGYGESLLNYQQETESIRAGFSFVR
jgi:phospholipase A1/A2